MLFDEFTRVASSWWHSYLTKIVAAERAGNLDSRGGQVLYPAMMLAVDVPGFRIAELVGARPTYSGLKIKKLRSPSIYRFLSQFEEPGSASGLKLACKNFLFRNLCLAHDYEMEQTKQRFPFIDLFPTWLINVDEPGPIFQFEPGFVSCAIENSVLINVRGSLARCKNILSLFITKNAITKPELTSLFEEVTKGIEVKGIHTAYGSDNMRLIVAGHLQAMFLTPGLRETTIGEFVNQHPDVIKRAFKTENFIYEPFLDWLEHDGTVIDKAINPDLLIQRDDGFYDIYDLKTAMLGRSRITKGEQRRRRFIDAVAEGVHQLSHYRMYFQFSANRELAEKKYGIRVSDPRLVLVVGSWENVDPREVIEATRAYSGIDIIDYDTLVHFFLGTAEKANPSIPTV